MQSKKIYDIVGIGIGPFNLSLAAMLQDHPQLTSLFIDQKPGFDWHPGINFPWARMQVPYFADLVTLANPQSKFTYINYLHQTRQLFRFGVQENIFPLRIEYNNYCQWVADQLPNLIFSLKCNKITYNKCEETYTIHCTDQNMCNKTFHAKRLVIGIGTTPNLPDCVNTDHLKQVIHSGEYLYHKQEILNAKDISIIGSGQSAAEIYYDLLQHTDQLKKLHWFTRSRRLAPMDYSGFALEMASPDYIDYFFDLPEHQKREVLGTQTYLYKGINQKLITAIHERLHLLYTHRHQLESFIHTSVALTDVQPKNEIQHLHFHHIDNGKDYIHPTKYVILATGYSYTLPLFLQLISTRINWHHNGWFKVSKKYSVDNNQTIFVQNADLYSHGFNAADLGLGVPRNSVILNTIFGTEYYHIEGNNTFQKFNF